MGKVVEILASRGSRLRLILLCSFRKSVCMEARVGVATALTSPADRNLVFISSFRCFTCSQVIFRWWRGEGALGALGQVLRCK